MTTQKGNHSEPNRSNDKSQTQGKGAQGFASMPKEQVREIAAQGGRHSHDNDHNKNRESNSNKTNK